MHKLNQSAGGRIIPCLWEIIKQKLIDVLVHAEYDCYARASQHIVTDAHSAVLGEIVCIDVVNLVGIEVRHWHECGVRCGDQHIHSLIFLLQHRFVHQCLLQVGSKRYGRVYVILHIAERLCCQWGVGTKRKSIRRDANGQTFI